MKILKLVIILIFASGSVHAATTSGDSAAPSGPGTSVNQNANNASKENSSGSGMSMMMSAVMAGMSAKEFAAQNYGMGALYAGMAIMSLMQSGAHDGAASGAGVTAVNTDSGVTAQNLTPLNPANFGGLDKNIQALTKGGKGFKADFKKGTVTVGDKTFAAADFASPASMQAAGFNPDQISAAMDTATKAEKKIAAKMGAATATNGFAEGGGGGGGVSYVDESVDSLAAGAGVGSPGLKESDRGPAGVAGMSKNFNGEPIGVAADSIFAMMNRRYILKDKQNAFINETDLLLRQK